jgi:predicted MFS family arabinose efflux permease
MLSRLMADHPIAYAFMVTAVYTPYFYIEDYALAIGVSPDMVYYLPSIMNVATFFGRMPPNILADKYVRSWPLFVIS